MYFLEWNVWVSIEISLKFVPKGQINNIPALVQIMAWRRPGDKLLSEPMMVSLLTHICVTRPQWVNFAPGYVNSDINRLKKDRNLPGEFVKTEALSLKMIRHEHLQVFKGLQVFCIWKNTWNPLKTWYLLSKVSTHSGISGNFLSEHSNAWMMYW